MLLPAAALLSAAGCGMKEPEFDACGQVNATEVTVSAENSGRIIKPSRGTYQMNDNFPVAGPEDLNLLPAPTIASALEKALAFINSYTIKVTDIDDPDTFLYNRKILIETQEFIEKQIARLK